MRYDPEIAETLAMPDGVDEAELPEGAEPHTPAQARIAFTRLVRDLGRDYRLWYGSELRMDTIAIDTIQRHLLMRWEPAETLADDDEDVLVEVKRHGAFLSELLARALGARWVDVGPSELGYWAMIVPPETRVWPFGRMRRFLAMGHREKDLVSYYLDLVARTKRARRG
jgi:hypothetical protein